MGIKNQNQIAKDLAKRRAARQDAKRKEIQEIKNLPEIEKLKLDIDILKGYVFRYKNDMHLPIIASKVKLYNTQIIEKEAQLNILLQKSNQQNIGDTNGQSQNI